MPTPANRPATAMPPPMMTLASTMEIEDDDCEVEVVVRDDDGVVVEKILLRDEVEGTKAKPRVDGTAAAVSRLKRLNFMFRYLRCRCRCCSLA